MFTSFVCSDKYVKQVFFINRSWISPKLQRRWELEFCLFSKNGEGYIFPKKEREVGKIVEEVCLGKVNYAYC